MFMPVMQHENQEFCDSLSQHIATSLTHTHTVTGRFMLDCQADFESTPHSYTTLPTVGPR